MKWAFIDYENVGGLSKVDLSCYSKVVLFVGAKQSRVDFGDKKYDAPMNIMLVQLKATQANNLDFHLAYYLGVCDSDAPENTSFEIISNDNGYAPLIAHIKSNGRACKQVKVSNTSGAKSKLIESLISRPKERRPQKVTSLRNHIASHMSVKGNEVAIQDYLNQLVNDKLIKVSGDNLEYKR